MNCLYRRCCRGTARCAQKFFMCITKILTIKLISGLIIITMKNSLKVVLLFLLVLTAGCQKETPAFLDETNSRKQVEEAVKETEQLESGMEQFQELEKSDKTPPENPILKEPDFINLSEPKFPDSEK